MVTCCAAAGRRKFYCARDGWGTIQAVTEQEADLAPITSADLQTETLLALEGLVVTSAQAPGGIELQQPQLTVLNEVREALPVLISKREIKAQLPMLLDHAVVTNRHPGRTPCFG